MWQTEQENDINSHTLASFTLPCPSHSYKNSIKNVFFFLFFSNGYKSPAVSILIHFATNFHLLFVINTPFLSLTTGETDKWINLAKSTIWSICFLGESDLILQNEKNLDSAFDTKCFLLLFHTYTSSKIGNKNSSLFYFMLHRMLPFLFELKAILQYWHVFDMFSSWQAFSYSWHRVTNKQKLVNISFCFALTLIKW